PADGVVVVAGAVAAGPGVGTAVVGAGAAAAVGVTPGRSGAPVWAPVGAWVAQAAENRAAAAASAARDFIEPYIPFPLLLHSTVLRAQVGSTTPPQASKEQRA